MSNEWTHFSLTFVEYPKQDIVGKFLAIFSLLPLAIVIIFITFFFIRRDLHTLTYASGVILNAILNVVLKRSIKSPRPLAVGRSLNKDLWEEYGMPSSHSQFMWFVFTYFVLFVCFRLQFQRNYFEFIWKTVWCGFCFLCAFLVSYGRIYLEYHTISQVLIGCLIGTCFGCLWFLFTVQIVAPYVFPLIVSNRFAKFFFIRDLSSIPDIAWFEYTTARLEAIDRKKRAAAATVFVKQKAS